MKIRATKSMLAGIASLAVIIIAAMLFAPWESADTSQYEEENDSRAVAKKMSRVEKNAAREEYFFKLMRNPATNEIPANIRNRELQFAKNLPSAEQAFQRAKTKKPSLQAINYNWLAAGPFDVGGRTRALGVDQRDPNIVLSGGVSGGMWKSTNGGDTWQLRTPDLANLSVTSIAQDPQNPDTWYYSSGEAIGNSAGATGAAYYGQGIYKSTDNGDTWSLMQQASSTTQGRVDVFNTVSRIVVSPISGSVFIASTGFGIYRSTDGETFSDSPVLGTEGEQLFTDLAVASDGTIAAAISEASFDDQQSQDPNSPNHNPGIFISTPSSDGQRGSWIEITPENFPDTYRRSVLAFAPSNPDVLYVFTLKGANNTSNQGVAFFKIDINDPQNPDPDNRSANLPDFRTNGEGSGYINLQGGYNMLVDVKPDDENYVFIGGTNLFRSDDGFSTAPSGGYDGSDEAQKDNFWIGGYKKDNGFASYPGQHPDQHVLVFPDPNNPNLMWAGHDGGLSVTNNVAASSVTWENRDDGYVTSQFYSTDLPESTGDVRLVGGTQDNGTPVFEFGEESNQSNDISSGDGGYADFTENYIFSSSQQGRVIRWSNDLRQLTYVSPSEAMNQLFIHPYSVDPNDENVMYYPEGDHFWRNTEMENIPNGNSSSGTTTGWEELQNVNLSSQYTITAVEVSRNPGNILYFGGYNSDLQPEIKRLENAKSATSGAVDISLPSSSNLSGAYIKDIAINPVNANEVIVVLSNYNIVGLYHTMDGGENWTAIEGNLTGNQQNPGPSLRSATMVPAESGTIYLLGTSTGLYSTQLLDGSNTVWGKESADQIGSAVTEYVASRASDGDVAAGTHGRGIYFGDFGGSTNAPSITANPLKGRPGETITLRATNFQFNTDPSSNDVTFGKVSARVLNATASQLEVEIPRGAIDRQVESNSVIITVKTGNQAASASFEILPPNDFLVKQNYPNPFNPTTTIPFDIPVDSRITLTIYNMSGQKVLEPIRNANYNAGAYTENIDLSGLSSGIYIYRIISRANSGGDTFIKSKKMTFIK